MCLHLSPEPLHVPMRACSPSPSPFLFDRHRLIYISCVNYMQTYTKNSNNNNNNINTAPRLSLLVLFKCTATYESVCVRARSIHILHLEDFGQQSKEIMYRVIRNCGLALTVSTKKNIFFYSLHLAFASVWRELAPDPKRFDTHTKCARVEKL